MPLPWWQLVLSQDSIVAKYNEACFEIKFFASYVSKHELTYPFTTFFTINHSQFHGHKRIRIRGKQFLKQENSFISLGKTNFTKVIENQINRGEFTAHSPLARMNKLRLCLIYNSVKNSRKWKTINNTYILVQKWK